MVPHADRDTAEKDARLRAWKIVVREALFDEYYRLGELHPFRTEVTEPFD
jgi:hypothetical protein